MPMSLDELRARIDAIDERILSCWLSARPWPSRWGGSAEAADRPVYAPHREAEIVRRLSGRDLDH